MSNPEAGSSQIHWGPKEKLLAGGALFLTVVSIASPTSSEEAHSKASPEEIDGADIEKCKEENPPRPSTLTLNDYLNIERWGRGYHVRPLYVGQEKKSLLEVARRRLRLNQLHAYKVSPERAQRVEAHVNRFAAGMVERANSGDETYRFYQGGGGAFVDGNFRSGPGGGLEPAADDYEGFGWLWRNVSDDEGKIVKQEISDNIYRYSDGTYYENPHPWILSVYDKNAQSTFESPPAYSLTECASVPGNGATQGWRVSHYDFNHLYEPGFRTIQKEPWLSGNTTLADVQLADRRASHFIDDRYNPDAQQ
jgi:hypothetical protein